MGKKLNHRIVNFWEWVEKTPNCWLWTGGKNSSDYGTVHANYRTLQAHRVSWELTNGPIPKGLCVLHTCDNPPCVRPTHLFLGTKLDNRKDMLNKNRQRNYTPPGEHHPQAKLTETQVLKIRKLWNSGKILQKYIAEKFNVAHPTISNIINRKSWKHI